MTKDKKRHKTDDNWVRNISSRPLDKTETQVLSYGLKHSVAPKHIPTEAIVSSVEAVLSRQRELSESAKDNIRSRIASTIQSSSLTDSNLTKDERQALKRLKTDENIVILPADKGRVTVVMDKTDYYDKIDTLFLFFIFFYFFITCTCFIVTFTILTIQYNIDMPIEDYVRNYLVRLITKNYSTLGNI